MKLTIEIDTEKPTADRVLLHRDGKLLGGVVRLVAQADVKCNLLGLTLHGFKRDPKTGKILLTDGNLIPTSARYDGKLVGVNLETDAEFEVDLNEMFYCGEEGHEGFTEKK